MTQSGDRELINECKGECKLSLEIYSSCSLGHVPACVHELGCWAAPRTRAPRELASAGWLPPPVAAAPAVPAAPLLAAAAAGQELRAVPSKAAPRAPSLAAPLAVLQLRNASSHTRGFL